MRPTLFRPLPRTGPDTVLHYKMYNGLMFTDRTFDYSLNGNLGSHTMITYGSYPGYFFNSAGSQINCGSGASIDDIFDSGGSFSVWLKPLGQGAGNAGKVFDKSTNTSIGIVLFCPASDTDLQLTLVTDTTKGEWTFPVDITGGIWQHMVITYDADTAAAGGAPTVYVDGVSVAVTEVAAPDDTRTSDAGAIMYIGVRAAGGTNWDGYMDDLRFIDRILTAAEVLDIYNLTKWRYGK